MCVCDVQLSAATDRINSLREEQEKLQQENTTILQTSQRKEEVTSSSIITLTPAVHCIILLHALPVYSGDYAGQPGGAGDLQTDKARSG